MSVAIVSTPLLEIGDFSIRIKQKTLSYVQPFLRPDDAKIRFLFDNATLYDEYYFFKGK